MAAIHPCVVCKLEVRGRQHALQCDECDRWQHRVKCTPGMTLLEYRLLSQQPDIQWKCSECSTSLSSEETVASLETLPEPESVLSEPVFESTRNSFSQQTDERPMETDISFEINQISFDQPEEHIEDSVIDPVPSPMDDTDYVTTYQIVCDGSQKGKDKLVESSGFSYVVKERKGATTYWVCSVRKKPSRCLATVIERDGMFFRGKSNHIHPACPGLLTSTEVAKAVKDKARREVFRPASNIVEQVITEQVDEREPCPSLPAPSNLARRANRARQRMRPAEPKDLHFEISEDHIPDEFLQADVRVGEFRHLVFYTPEQFRLLETCKTWYMDATFSIVREPFKQMFSIHAFVRSGGDTKQVPLAFVLMSRKRRIDYKKVFKSLRQKMSPGMQPKAGVADFEAGIWQAFRRVFPSAAVSGCSFHWNQAVFRKIQKLGLEDAYRRQDATYKFLRKVMSLPYLPAEHIYPAFLQLRVHATTPQLQELMDYVDSTWMNSTVWPIKSWSVFGKATRTNNDVEGWHRRLNLRAGRPNVQFYLLIPILLEEAKLLSLRMRFVSEGKLKRNQRLRVRQTQGRLFRIWDDYSDGRLSASQLLREVANLI